MSNSLTKINSHFDNLLRGLEDKYTTSTLVSISDDILGQKFVLEAIKNYQSIIRSNKWYFPSLSNIDVETFSKRWVDVHDNYFQFAFRVADILIRKKSIGALSDPDLLNLAIRSETMRGWVGKRSESGLDSLIEDKIKEAELALDGHLSVENIDELLSLCGVYTGDKLFMSAESEIIREYSYLKRALDTGINQSNSAQEHNRDPKQNLLRWYCRYSSQELEDKYITLQGILGKQSDRSDLVLKNKHRIAAIKQAVPSYLQKSIWNTLRELRFLNHINLNLEVKYSFKGWAGLMHTAVFCACAHETGISSNVYQIYSEMR